MNIEAIDLEHAIMTLAKTSSYRVSIINKLTTVDIDDRLIPTLPEATYLNLQEFSIFIADYVKGLKSQNSNMKSKLIAFELDNLIKQKVIDEMASKLHWNRAKVEDVTDTIKEYRI